MLYQKKPVIIDADKYTAMGLGLEDGFDTLIYGTVSETPTLDAIHSWYGSHPLPTDHLYLPYIKTECGHCYLSKNDYLITNIVGIRYKMGQGIFEATYTPPLIQKEHCVRK